MLLKTRHCQISFECMRKAKAYLCFRPPGGGSGQPDPCGDKVEQLLELIHVHHHKSLLSGGACIQLMQAGCCYRILLSAILNILLSLSCPWWLWQSDARYGRSINNCPPLADGPSPLHWWSGPVQPCSLVSTLLLVSIRERWFLEKPPRLGRIRRYWTHWGRNGWHLQGQGLAAAVLPGTLIASD